MTNEEQYNQAFCNTFQINPSQLHGLAYQGVKTWDSIGHMSLVAALEEAFDIMMETEDIINLSSYIKGKEILEQTYDIKF